MSGRKVIGFRSGVEIASPGRPNAETIALLREALAQAEAGEVAGVVLVKTYSDGAATFHHAGYHKAYATLGAVEAAKHDLLK